jgi:hypothetical protein
MMIVSGTTAPAAEGAPERYSGGGSGRPPGPHVGQDRAEDEEDAPVPPEPSEAGDRRLAGCQGVALDLHVEDVLEEEPEYGSPEDREAHLRDDQGPYYELARAHRRGGDDGAGADDLPYRHRIWQVAVRNRRQVLTRKFCGEVALPGPVCRFGHSFALSPVSLAVFFATTATIKLPSASKRRVKLGKFFPKERLSASHWDA